MLIPPIPANERQRLGALWSYEILDTRPEDAFDAMTKLAANLCQTPIAIISLVDAQRQWFKSQCGLDGMTSTDRDVAFCAHTIAQDGIFEVPDAARDPRFADNPLVTGDPRIRFYAGAPLIDPGGMALGALCVVDRTPRRLTPDQRMHLERLAQAIVGLITMRIRRSEFDERRAALRENEKAYRQLLARSELLKKFAKNQRARRPAARAILNRTPAPAPAGGL